MLEPSRLKFTSGIQQISIVYVTERERMMYLLHLLTSYYHDFMSSPLQVGFHVSIQLMAHSPSFLQNCSCDTQPEVTSLFNLFPICNLPRTFLFQDQLTSYYMIGDFTVVPSWVLAVVIGLVGGSRLHQLGPTVPGSLAYSITFFMYAAMITSGLFVHCLYLVECGAGPPSKVSHKWSGFSREIELQLFGVWFSLCPYWLAIFLRAMILLQ